MKIPGSLFLYLPILIFLIYWGLTDYYDITLRIFTGIIIIWSTMSLIIFVVVLMITESFNESKDALIFSSLIIIYVTVFFFIWLHKFLNKHLSVKV